MTIECGKCSKKVVFKSFHLLMQHKLKDHEQQNNEHYSEEKQIPKKMKQNSKEKKINPKNKKLISKKKKPSVSSRKETKILLLPRILDIPSATPNTLLSSEDIYKKITEYLEASKTHTGEKQYGCKVSGKQGISKTPMLLHGASPQHRPSLYKM